MSDGAFKIDFHEMSVSVAAPEIAGGALYRTNEEGKDEQLKEIEGLSKVNVFVGANNSGKSKILREILKDQNCFPTSWRESKILEYQSLLNAFFSEPNNYFDNVLSQISPCFMHINIDGKRYFKCLFFNATSIFSITNKLEKEEFDKLNKSIYSSLFRMTLLRNHFVSNNEKVSRKIKEVTDKETETKVFHEGNVSINSNAIDRLETYVKRYDYMFENFIEKNKKYSSIQEISYVYIPTMRTLRTLIEKDVSETELVTDLNLITFKEYFNGGFSKQNELSAQVDLGFKRKVKPEEQREFGKTKVSRYPQSVLLHNGQDLYEQILDMRLGTREERERLESFEEFLKDNFFGGDSVQLIPRRKGVKQLHIKIGDEAERPIYELGDGLQMIIICTFPLFSEEQGYIVVEEPELFIHPGLQRKLMDVYLNHPRSKNFQFFLATHSNHILDEADLSSQASVYRVEKFFTEEKRNSPSREKLPDFRVNLLAQRDENALRCLGVSNSSVYLSNCTLWVEGLSDKLYFAQFLKTYLEGAGDELEEKYSKCHMLREGVHYNYVLSAGDNIVHFDFSDTTDWEELTNKLPVKALCGKAMVIVDDDYEKNATRKAKMAALLGDRFYVLPVVEVENLLTPQIAARTIGLGYKNVWKNEGQKEDLTNSLETELRGLYGGQNHAPKRLGSLIEEGLSAIPTSRRGRKKKFADDGGAPKEGKEYPVRDKNGFAALATRYITYENMGDKAKEVVRKILDFLLAYNPDFQVK